MSIFSQNESGTSFHRSRFTKSISNTMRYDCRFHDLIPVLKRFVLPGDIWRIGGDVLVRFHPMLSPTLTANNFRVRYFFVPLRLLDDNAELIITGSKDGHLYAPTEAHPNTPEFPNFVYYADKVSYPTAYVVSKYSLWDYMGIQLGDYEPIKKNVCLPAAYWTKGYLRIAWDYYFDENLNANKIAYDDFETYWQAVAPFGATVGIQQSALSKDYFTSALPWQLKGVAPTIAVTGSATVSWTPDFTPEDNIWVINHSGGAALNGNTSAPVGSREAPFLSNGISVSDQQAFSRAMDQVFEKPQTASATVTQLGFDADDERVMMAQTRIFERLARCGSRYTEYLRSNFGTAPADETLQRAQYLGGWKVPIVTTEVLQTGEDTVSSTPVGTMRGHGITRGGNRIGTFYAKEFGLLFGIAEVRPNVEYTTGIPRELTYKSRFDFFNPSFQHLSEQEIRNGELFVSSTDGLNDDTFGFQAYANELRTAHDETVGDLRDSLSFWTQSLHFTSRPNLNNAFISGASHRASFNAPFVVSNVNARPIIVQFRNNLDVYRPMVRYATPGLVDHL